jgi:DNA-binding transcriptional LysR family regulator
VTVEAPHFILCFTERTNPYLWTFQSEAGSNRSILVNARVASDDADILVDAAAAGLGLLYTTDWHVGPLLANGRLVEILSGW